METVKLFIANWSWLIILLLILCFQILNTIILYKMYVYMKMGLRDLSEKNVRLYTKLSDTKNSIAEIRYDTTRLVRILSRLEKQKEKDNG